MYKTQCLLAFVMLYMVLAHSWEFAVSTEDRLEFYINDTKTDTVRLPSQNPSALAYDEVYNKLLYVDKKSGNDDICGYYLSFMYYKCYMKSSGRDIQGLAYDPISQKLFFTDTKEKSINWLTFQPGSKNNAKGKLLIKMDKGIPTDIAVDSCKGYIYWINTNISKSTIERARLDGSDREIIINSTYNMDLHSLAIDQQTKKIYWMMPKNSLVVYLYSADLKGNNKLVRGSNYRGSKLITHPNILTVSNKNLILIDWCSDCGSKYVRKFRKPSINSKSRTTYSNLVNSEGEVGIVAIYKIADRVQGIQECQYLTRLVQHDTVKIAREYEGSYCVHGVKENGQSRCQCTPGYTGERCDVSVCKNHCLHGKCTFNKNGFPECSCSTGYFGTRCEMTACPTWIIPGQA